MAEWRFEIILIFFSSTTDDHTGTTLVYTLYIIVHCYENFVIYYIL